MATPSTSATTFGVRLRVRILGIDTPETVDPGAAVGCWGPEATAFALANLEGQRVALVTDPPWLFPTSCDPDSIWCRGIYGGWRAAQP
jgi:hypothetical protein